MICAQENKKVVKTQVRWPKHCLGRFILVDRAWNQRCGYNYNLQSLSKQISLFPSHLKAMIMCTQLIIFLREWFQWARACEEILAKFESIMARKNRPMGLPLI